MRMIWSLLAVVVLALGLLAGPATGMEPPGKGAQSRFGCVDGRDSPVAGHPGAAGLLNSAPRVRELTGDPSPTAWNAVEHAGPIVLGGCE